MPLEPPRAGMIARVSVISFQSSALSAGVGVRVLPIFRIYHSPHALRVSPVPMRWKEITKIKTVWMTANQRKTITTKDAFCIFRYTAMLLGIIESYARMAS